jgi:hypothetical protein
LNYDRDHAFRPYRWSILVCPLVLALFVLFVGHLVGGRGFYQARPVSAANSVLKGASHATFNQDCSLCHTEHWQAARRLCPGNANLATVANRACEACHRPVPRDTFRQEVVRVATREPLGGPPALVHHPAQISAQVPACATCHREHRGEATLTHAVDGYCVDCHGSLKRSDGKPPSVLPVSSFICGHPPFRAPVDGARLRFNHKLHAGQALLRDDGSRSAIECSTCHARDSRGGRYMLPVRYEDQCRSCHPLVAPLIGQWNAPGLQEEKAKFMHEPVPHGKPPEQVRVELRTRYADFVRAHPDVLDASLAVEPVRPFPGRRRSSPAASSPDAWVAVQSQAAERVLFQSSGGCRYCHEPAGPVTPKSLPGYFPTEIPARWLTRSIFSHEKHVKLPLSLDCAECHLRAKASELTSDNLMPKIAVCRKCHDAPAAAGALGGSDCITCHRYHELFDGE